MELIVDDQAPIHVSSQEDGLTGTALAAQEAVRLALDCEQLGWDGYWAAAGLGTTGHPHALTAMASAAATITGSIRVGTGLVLPADGGPVRGAAGFMSLAHLHPRRSDLIVTPDLDAPPGPRSPGPRIAALLAALRHEDAQTTLDTADPPDRTSPRIWLAGRHAEDSAVAAAHGLPFCLRLPADELPRPEALDHYRRFCRTEAGPGAPRIALAVRIACADDPDEAAVLRALLAWAQPADQPTEQPATTAPPPSARPRTLVGTPEQVRPHLAHLLDLYRPDTLAVSTPCPDHQLRLRSFALVRELVTGRRPTA
ncbi:LLM class flavin-dependent oxidoreductase [Kitasatospora sp. NPDC096128]|uniref:LLM class flavin-dependent oxidoreductase n=1 Tax=Kitasatospora sp. NPDC096128 TaxID=3155547 RepID=UPI00333137EE